jgi:hypothetical protein
MKLGHYLYRICSGMTISRTCYLLLVDGYTLRATPPKAHYANNGAHIATAIGEGENIAVSDGSFNEGIRIAAWVIESTVSAFRMSGQATCPGREQDQSS